MTELGPLKFAPLFMPRLWGGRRLQTLLGKALPPGEPIGESWEIAHLPGHESLVAQGPLAGRGLTQVLREYGQRLLGSCATVNSAFPLLIKYLDANQHLSVQVHPLPGSAAHTAVKHEAWYIVAAQPGAQIFAGFKPGASKADVVRAAGSADMADLLERHAARPGDCYYLPSGTPHALGAGILVAEVQTPSDITYRLYDWDRLGLDGRPRELHVRQSLENLRDGQALPEVSYAKQTAGPRRVADCASFRIDELQLPAGGPLVRAPGQMRIWMMISAAGTIVSNSAELEFRPGDTLLLPACAAHSLEAVAPGTALEITVPD